MNPFIATVFASAISVLAPLSSLARPEFLAEAPISLCGTYTGPAVVVPDESGNNIAVHAGPYAGISMVSLDSGKLNVQIPISLHFLAASFAPDRKSLTVAVSDGSRIGVRIFDLSMRKEIYSQYFPDQMADFASFTPDGRSLLGVTSEGNVFKISVGTDTLEVLNGATASAQAITISSNGARLYIAGKGVTVVDIDRLRILSTLTREKLLLGVAVSNDSKLLAVRNRHNIEILDAANGARIGDSVNVDPTPDAISASLVSIAFSPDGSQLFYVRASYVESELISFSLPSLNIDQRSKVGPIPSAIAIVPSRRWLLLTTGSPGEEQLLALNMKTLAAELQVKLATEPNAEASSQHHGCTKAPHSG